MRAFASILIFCVGLSGLDTLSADTPIGTWELSAKEDGELYNGFITFSADFTYTGYTIRTGTRDLSQFSGIWVLDGSDLTASISLTSDGETFTGSVESKFKAGVSIKGKVFYDDGDIANFSCVPLGSPPNLTASYTFSGKIGNSAVADTRPFTKDLVFGNVYGVPARSTSAEAPVSQRGVVNKGRAIVNSKGSVFLILDVTDDTFVTRAVSLVGKLNRRDGSLKFRGAKGVKASVKLTKGS